MVLSGDARDLSFMMTAAGIGALTGAFATASMGTLRRRGLVYAASGMVMGGILVLFGLQQSLIPAIVLVYLVAGCSQLFITMASALYNTHTRMTCADGSWVSRPSWSRAACPSERW